MGDERFAVVLHDLEMVSHKYLPTMSDIYGVAHKAAQQTHAAPLPPSFPEPPQVTVEKAYDDLKRSAERILNDIQHNLADTAAALQATVSDYEQQDRADAAEFQRLMQTEPTFQEEPGKRGIPKKN